MPSVEQHAHRRRRPHQALGAHAGFGQAEVQRLVGLLRERAIDVDQVTRPRQLARDDDLVLAQAGLDRELGRLDRRQHHALADDVVGVLAEVAVGVLLHLRHDQLLVEGAAVDADAHRLAVIDRDLADGRELLVAPLAGADVAGIDAVLVERVARTRGSASAAGGRCSESRRSAARCSRRRACGCLISGTAAAASGRLTVTRTISEPGLPQLDALLRGRAGIRRVGHRHRLHDDGRAAADGDVADLHADGAMPLALHLSNYVFLPVRRRASDRLISSARNSARSIVS